MQRVFVLAAVADRVDEIATLAIDGHELDAGRLVGAERPRIDDQFVGRGIGRRARPGLRGRPPVDSRQLLP